MDLNTMTDEQLDILLNIILLLLELQHPCPQEI